MQPDPAASAWAPLVVPVVVAVATSASTLLAVVLTQRASRKAQQQQLDATAQLERERRVSAERSEREKREHEVRERRWQHRFDAYAAFVSRAESVATAAARPDVTPALAAQAVEEFATASYRALILAPPQVAELLMQYRHAMRLVALSAGQGHDVAKQLESTRALRAELLQAFRSDLGVPLSSADAEGHAVNGDPVAA
jgi:hypothetical protein